MSLDGMELRRMVVNAGLQNHNVQISRHGPVDLDKYPGIELRKIEDHVGRFVVVAPQDAQLLTVHVCNEGRTYWSASGGGRSLKHDEPLYLLQNHLLLPTDRVPRNSTFGAVAYLHKDGTDASDVCLGLFDVVRLDGLDLRQEPPAVRTQLVQKICWEWRVECPSVHYHYAGHEDAISDPLRCDLSGAPFVVDPADIYVYELPMTCM